MKAFLFCILSGLLTHVLAAPLDPRGSCLLLCGGNGVTCPSGYRCASNGCGSECYQNVGYAQPAGCSPVLCDLACPLGFVRDKMGCDQCTCDYSALHIG